MHHRASAAFDHLRNQETIKANCCQKIQVQFGEPVIVRQGDKAAARRRRATNHMGQDVDAAHVLTRGFGQDLPSLGRRQVRLHELDAVDGLSVPPSGSDHPGAAGPEAIDGGAAQTLGAAADEHALSRELGRIGLDGHIAISKALIASCSSVNR